MAIVCIISSYINHICCQNVLLFEEVVGLSSFIDKEHALLVYLIIILYKLIYYACSCSLYSITRQSKTILLLFSYFWDLEDNPGITKLTVFPLTKMSVMRGHAEHTWIHHHVLKPFYKICRQFQKKLFLNV